MPAQRGLPQWLRSMPPAAYSPFLDAEFETVKRCPPFVDAMAHGFVIPLPCDVTGEGPAAELTFTGTPKGDVPDAPMIEAASTD